MADQRYINFIEDLIRRTKEQKLNWRYLDRNSHLYEGMHWVDERPTLHIFSSGGDKTVPNFNVEDSFYTNIGDTYVVLYVWNNNPAKLYVVPNTYKKVVKLEPDEYGEYITRLLNLVQSQFPSGEAFIDSILNQAKEE